MAKKFPTPETMGLDPAKSAAEARKELLHKGDSLNPLPGAYKGDDTPAPIPPTPHQPSVIGGSILLDIPLDSIDPNPDQPRTFFDENELEQLASSLIAQKQIQSISVWRKEDGRYELIAGERRCRAARLAKWETIRAEVHPNPHRKTSLAALAENDARSNLRDFERYLNYQKALEEGEVENQAALARAVGKSKTFVSRVMSFGRLPPEAIEYLSIKGNEAILTSSFVAGFSAMAEKEPALVTQAIQRIAVRDADADQDSAQIAALNWLKATISGSKEEKTTTHTLLLNGKRAGEAKIEGTRIFIVCDRGVNPSDLLKKLM